MPIRVQQIDHIELYVPDREQAARWYEAVLGVRSLPEHADWAADAEGPVMISSAEASAMIALFTGPAQRNHPVVGIKRIAFRAGAADFAAFVAQVRDVPVYDTEGRELRALDVVDHDRALSVYFCDPYGTRLEVTTYEHTAAREQLARRTLQA
jgi:catechol 2,3-dioxygenase-like lactoylglutathione lyase family enzyme